MKNISFKLAGAFVAFAFAVAAVPASAITTDQVNAIVSMLSSFGVDAATVANIQATLTGQAPVAGGGSTPVTGGSSAACGPFTADLTMGSTSPQVVTLQTFLEEQGYLTIPAGVSKGYFGALTQSAVSAFQAAKGISPTAGYFGPVTRAEVAKYCGATTPSTGTPTTGTPSTGLQGGEASLEASDLKSEDDAQEGEMKHVATFEFDVEDGDVQINRLDLEFVFTGDDTQADDEPWDAFETITLMIDGDEVAEEDVDDEDDWLRDNTPFVFRLSNIDYVASEGDTVEIEIYLTAMSNVDGADSGDAAWTIAVDDDGLRAVDGEGIQNYIGNDTDTVAFDVEELGEGEEIKIKSSSSDPDAKTWLVDADDESEWHGVFVFGLKAEDNDIDIEELVLTVTTGSSTYENVVDDIYVEIDGEEFDDVEVADEDTTSADLTFDIDKDATVDEDDTVEVAVFVKFKKQDGNYVDGEETIQISTVSVDGEGLDDVSDIATVTGSEHILSTAVAAVENVSWDSSESANGTNGVIDLFFTVTAEEDDFDVLGTAILDTINSGTFATSATSTTIEVSDSGYGYITRISGDDVTRITDGFRVNEGDTVRFRVRYTADSAGTYEVLMESVAGQELEDEDQLSPTLILES